MSRSALYKSIPIFFLFQLHSVFFVSIPHLILGEEESLYNSSSKKYYSKASLLSYLYKC